MSDMRAIEVPEETAVAPNARYCSSAEIGAVIDLLMEFREITQSCAAHRRATVIIRELGAGAQIRFCTPANYADTDC